MSLLKKKVTPKNKTILNKVVLKLDKDLLIDEDVFVSALKIIVPNIVGMSIKEAVALLQSKGINYKLIGKEVIPKEGSVSSTSPVAGAPLGLEQVLQVYVNDHVKM